MFSQHRPADQAADPPAAGIYSPLTTHFTTQRPFNTHEPGVRRPTLSRSHPLTPTQPALHSSPAVAASDSLLTTHHLNFFSRFFVKSLTFMKNYRLILQISVNQSNLNGFSLT
jgi:hypothetical protein